MGTQDDSLEDITIASLLSLSPDVLQKRTCDLLPHFSSPLKTNFEDINLWQRFGLVLALKRDSPRSALQAFDECLRINQHDPLPAMLAAKLLLYELNDPDAGLELANDAISRCQKLQSATDTANITAIDASSTTTTTTAATTTTTTTTDRKVEENGYNGVNSDSSIKQYSIQSVNTSSSGSGDCAGGAHGYGKCSYKNIDQLLSKCYLLTSIMHAHIYEREPESMKQFKENNLEASFKYLNLAERTYSQDYLIYFHKALHDAKQRSYSSAIDNIRQAIRLNPHHVPSMQLLMLSLSALKLYNEALLLCESTLHEFEDNLMLLYIKCNLEQCLVETKGYKSALNTAQYMLKCIRKRFSAAPAVTNSSPKASSTKTTATTITATIGTDNTIVVSGAGGGELHTTISLIDQAPLESKQSINLFAEDSCSHKQDLFSGELSVWLMVAEIFIRVGSISDAEQCVDEAANHVNGALSHQLMFVRGLIAKAKNSLLEAKSFLQSCLALCPRHARALQQMAHVYYLLGNYSTAEKFLKDSLDVDSDCDKTWHYLGLVYIETNQHDKAKESKERASQLEDSKPVIPISTISRLTRES